MSEPGDGTEPRGAAAGRRSRVIAASGVGSAGLAALAATRHWFAPRGVDEATLTQVMSGGGQVPSATALGLVVLAAWGALLVLRGRWRRAVAVLGAAAAVGVLVVTLAAWRSVPDQLGSRLGELGAAGHAVRPTGWYAVGLVAACGSLVSLAAAWWTLPTWPEMGRRYDAPGARGPGEDRPSGSGRELWDALNEGHDPTSDPG